MAEWNRIESKPGHDYKIFQSRHDLYRSPQGVEEPFVVLEAPDWVNVIALTAEQQVVMVRQFRHGVREETWEFPGGLVDPDESPLQAAQRELLEESGYAAPQLTPLGWVHPNPATQTNRCWSYLAYPATYCSAPTPDPTEDLRVELWPLADFDEAVQKGRLRHALVLDTWLFYKLSIQPVPLATERLVT